MSRRHSEYDSESRPAGDKTGLMPFASPANPKEQLIALRWFSTPQNGETHIGIVGLADPTLGYFKVYIGVARGSDAQSDVAWIAAMGAPVGEGLARHLVGTHPLFAGLEFMP